MITVLPSQRNSVKDKQSPEFYKPTYDYYIDLATSLKDWTTTLKCIKAANGIVDMDTYEYVLKPLGNTIKDNEGKNIGAKLPGEFRNTDFITPIKEKNLGEYIELPYKFFVKVDNPDAIMQRDNQLKSEVGKLMEQAFINLMNKQQGEGGISESKEVPDINTFAKNFVQNWLDERASRGQHVLNLINDITDFDVRRIQDFFYWWATEEFYTYRHVKNGEVFVESISPLDGYPVPNGEQFVEDYDAFVIKRRISWNQFIDKYGDEIPDKDKTYVEELNKSYSSTGRLQTKAKFLRIRFGAEFDKDIAGAGGDEADILFDGTTNKDIDETIVLWKTEIPIKLLTYENIMGELLTIEVSNDYVFDASLGDIEIKSEHKQVVYVGKRFGTKDRGIYLKPKEFEVQRYDERSNTCKLPVGGKQGILNGIPRNPIPIRMVPYLAFDRFIYLQLERHIAKYKGNITLMPKSLVNPDEAGSSAQKYFYMMADGTIIYDDTLVSQTESQAFRIVGNSGLEQYLTVLIDLRAKNKQEAYDLANMNDERAGQAANNQTVSNANQNIYRAKLGSTLMITMFNKALEREHRADLEFSKIAWIEGKVGSYFDKSTNTPITVEVDSIDHLNTKYTPFVRNSKAEEKKLQQFQDLAFNASQNGDLDIASQAIMADSTPELHIAIKEFTVAKREFEKSQVDAQNEAIKYAADKKSEDVNKLIEANRELADIKADSAAEVAYIQGMGFNDETKGENTFTDANILANAKNAREERKLKLAEKTQSDKKELDDKKLKIVAKKANNSGK